MNIKWGIDRVRIEVVGMFVGVARVQVIMS